MSKYQHFRWKPSNQPFPPSLILYTDWFGDIPREGSILSEVIFCKYSRNEFYSEKRNKLSQKLSQVRGLRTVPRQCPSVCRALWCWLSTCWLSGKLSAKYEGFLLSGVFYLNLVERNRRYRNVQPIGGNFCNSYFVAVGPTPWKCREYIFQSYLRWFLLAKPEIFHEILLRSFLPSTLHSYPSTSILRMISFDTIVSRISLSRTDCIGGYNYLKNNSVVLKEERRIPTMFVTIFSAFTSSKVFIKVADNVRWKGRVQSGKKSFWYFVFPLS